MAKCKDRIIRMIQQNARKKMGKLSRIYLRAPPQYREEIQAGIEIERWLADSCRKALGEEPERPQ